MSHCRLTADRANATLSAIHQLTNVPGLPEIRGLLVGEDPAEFSVGLEFSQLQLPDASSMEMDGGAYLAAPVAPSDLTASDRPHLELIAALQARLNQATLDRLRLQRAEAKVKSAEDQLADTVVTTRRHTFGFLVTRR